MDGRAPAMKADLEVGSPDGRLSVETPPRRAETKLARALMPRYGLIYALVVMAVVYAVLMPSVFPTLRNLQSIVNISAPTLLLGLAITPLLIAGELDLSVAATFGLSAIMTAYLNVELGLPVGWAILLALGTGLAIGVLNAVLIVRLGADSLVVTLGMGSALGGVALAFTTEPVSGLSAALVRVTNTRVGGFQISVFITIVALLVMYYVWRFTPLGR